MFDLKKIEMAINMISAEKKIPKEKIVEIIEAAIKTAYKKDFGNKNENVNVVLDLEEQNIEITLEKTVVKVVEDPYTEISFDELGDDAEGFSEGDVIELDITDDVLGDEKSLETFGRIASQAARQVIIQKMNDTEKEKIFNLFQGKEGQVINMKVEIVDSGKVIFDYNGNQVVLPKSEQVSRDMYVAGARFFLLIAEVSKNDTSSRVILSRRRKELVSALFAEFVPEIGEGIITIDNIVRQPGIKTKILVSSNYDEIDPVGTLIGQKGIRVKGVMEELSGEKIDIIPNNGDIRDIIKKSLSPAEVVRVEISEEEESYAKVFILPSERAKAVGKGGLNVNLASKLTGYKISIEDIEEETEEKENQ
ncbi:transcription termination factor NusA [Candidatus Gracilibacteria bacterium]|nr:MAG: transcription termination factor NusA [Candidatus Gracilibacteria bacterium]